MTGPVPGPVTVREERPGDEAGCILVGDADYYARFGFVPAPALAPPGQPADHFMVKVLAGPPPRGPVAFHAAFGPGAA